MLCADDFGFESERKKIGPTITYVTLQVRKFSVLKLKSNFALATAMKFENNTREARLQYTYATSVFEVVYKLFFLCLTNA